MPGNKMIKINLKRLLNVFVFGMCVVMHAATANSDTSDALENLYIMQSSTMSAIGNYYMFSGLQGDSRYSRRIDANIKQFEDSLGTLTSPNNAVVNSEALASSLDIWQQYKDLLETNRSDFLSVGYANARLTSDLSVKATEVKDSLQNLYDQTIKDTQFRISAQTAKTRKMGLIIKSIVSEYIARSTSNSVTTSYSFNEGGMKNQAKIFNQLLNELKKESVSDKRIYKMTDQIDVKWSFISKSVTNYNENSVPFIVSTNGDRITKSLKTIGEHYSQKIQAKK
jgi:hypothetical protein